MFENASQGRLKFQNFSYYVSRRYGLFHDKGISLMFKSHILELEYDIKYSVQSLFVLWHFYIPINVSIRSIDEVKHLFLKHYIVAELQLRIVLLQNTFEIIYYETQP